MTSASSNGSVKSLPVLFAPMSTEGTSNASKKAASCKSSETSDSRRKKRGSDQFPSDVAGGMDVAVCTPDGRLCKLCGVKDATIDYVNGNISIKWSKPLQYNKVKKEWSNDGFTCYYCNKMFLSQYKQGKYNTIDDLLQDMGNPAGGEALSTEVKSLRTVIVDNCINQGKHNVRINSTVLRAAKDLVQRDQESGNCR